MALAKLCQVRKYQIKLTAHAHERTGIVLSNSNLLFMKNSTSLLTMILLFAASLFCACDKDDEYTIENKQVTGELTFVRTAFIPLSFDSTGTIPLTARITMEGDGTISDIGDVQFETTFTIDLVLGQGTDFLTTYTSTSPGDTFSFTGTSQAQPNGSFLVQDEAGTGTGKFSNFSGEGTTTVWLNQAQDGGTATVDWIVTY